MKLFETNVFIAFREAKSNSTGIHWQSTEIYLQSEHIVEEIDENIDENIDESIYKNIDE